MKKVFSGLALGGWIIGWWVFAAVRMFGDYDGFAGDQLAFLVVSFVVGLAVLLSLTEDGGEE